MAIPVKKTRSVGECSVDGVKSLDFTNSVDKVVSLSGRIMAKQALLQL